MTRDRGARLLGRARHDLRGRLAARGLRLRRGDRRARRRRADLRHRGGPAAREGCRRGGRPPARPARGVRERPGRRRDQDERALRGEVPARLRPVAARDRRSRRRPGARAGGGGGRPRLHRQGQRPAALRARLQGQLPGRDGDRAPARPDLVPRGGDRVRARARHPDHGHQELSRTRSTRTSSAARSRPASSRIPGRPRRRTRSCSPATRTPHRLRPST